MKSATKPPKVNSLSLAKNVSQFLAKIEFDLQPLLVDSSILDTVTKITTSIAQLEDSIKLPEKVKALEITEEFQKTDKALDKLKIKVNDLQNTLDNIERHFQEKISAKFAILQKTDPKDKTDQDNRNKVEALMKSIKHSLESGKKKLQEIQKPTEQALKRLHAIKPQLYALGLPENLERCQKKAERLSEELGSLCSAAAEMTVLDIAFRSAALITEVPIKKFLPQLKAEIARSGKLLEQADAHLQCSFPTNSPAPAPQAPSQTATSTATSPTASTVSSSSPATSPALVLANAASASNNSETYATAPTSPTPLIKELVDSKENAPKLGLAA